MTSTQELSSIVLERILQWNSQRSGLHETKRRSPLVVGLQAPQGAGKTTLVSAIQLQTQLQGLSCVSISLDDFYLTRQSQIQLHESHPDWLLFEHRGNPGTHDLDLATQTVEALTASIPTVTPPIPPSLRHYSVSVPSYDKSANEGRGERRPRSEWKQVNLPIDVLLIEGWCLGFKAISHKEILEIYNRQIIAPPIQQQLQQDQRQRPDQLMLRRHPIDSLYFLNDRLRDMENQIYPFIDAFVQIQSPDIGVVYEWRWEQEVKSNGARLSRDQCDGFVRGFMPAYELYQEQLNRDGFFFNRSLNTGTDDAGSDDGGGDRNCNQLVVKINENRQVLFFSK